MVPKRELTFVLPYFGKTSFKRRANENYRKRFTIFLAESNL